MSEETKNENKVDGNIQNPLEEKQQQQQQRQPEKPPLTKSEHTRINHLMEMGGKIVVNLSDDIELLERAIDPHADRTAEILARLIRLENPNWFH